jgi:hypothetical protein
MPRVKEIVEGDTSMNAGGSGEVLPLKRDENGMRPTTPKGYKADQLASELKVLKLEQKNGKLKKKLKTKGLIGQEASSSSSNEEGNDSSFDDESCKSKRGKGKKKHGSKPSYNTTSFNYDSLPSNHTFTSVHSRKAPRFDGMSCNTHFLQE